MKKQSGATLVIALSLLTIITLSVVYSLENSSIQSRMVANSVYSLRTYQATNNELSALIRAWNTDPSLIVNNTNPETVNTPNVITTPARVGLRNELIFKNKYAIGKQGNEIGVDAPVQYPLYEASSRGTHSFAVSNQSIGFMIHKLGISGATSVN